MSSMREKVRLTVGDKRVVRVQRMLAPTVRWNLTALARVYRTDKAGGHSYTPLYQRHLGALRNRPVRLLEIGIGGYDSATWGGASLRMWREFFRQGEIHGLDIEEKLIDEPRIHVHRGDQSDQDFLHDLARRHGPFDIIIDDGSHVNAHIRASFEALFVDHLTSDGFYIIEDMSTAYLAEYGGGPPGTAGTSIELVQRLIDDLNRSHWAGRAARPVAALHAYEKIAFIQRA